MSENIELGESEILDEGFTGTKDNYKYAGFWVRFVAYLVDRIVIFIPIVFVVMPTVQKSFKSFNTKSSEDIITAVFLLIFITGPWLYTTLMHSSRKRATLGKLMAGVQVVDIHYNKISFGKATGRYFSHILSRLILCIGYIMAAFDNRKQALHDKIAGTYVVHKSINTYEKRYT